jgi:anti-sigma regulatory factor (Ser/Thr protein kinase)
VGQARHTVADQLTAVGVRDETCDDALLVLSELVSNAVKHAAPLPNGRIAVGWTVLDDALHLEITDGGSVTRPQASVATCSAGAVAGWTSSARSAGPGASPRASER